MAEFSSVILEIFEHSVFPHCGLRALETLKLVCRWFNDLMWKSTTEYHLASAEHLPMVVAHCQPLKIRSLHFPLEQPNCVQSLVETQSQTLKNLQELRISIPSFDWFILVLNSLRLTRLEILYPCTPESTEHEEARNKFIQLKHFGIQNGAFDDTMEYPILFKWIPQCTNLQYLFQGRRSAPLIDPLDKLVHLKSLHLDNLRGTTDKKQLECICTLPNVTALSLCVAETTSEVSRLYALTALKFLSNFKMSILRESRPCPNFLKPLESLSQLRELYLGPAGLYSLHTIQLDLWGIFHLTQLHTLHIDFPWNCSIPKKLPIRRLGINTIKSKSVVMSKEVRQYVDLSTLECLTIRFNRVDWTDLLFFWKYVFPSSQFYCW